MAKGFRGYDFSDDEAAALRTAGIDGVPALWARAAKDPEEPLERLSEGTGINLKRLRKVLAGGAERKVPPARGSLLSRHWLDLVVLCGVALVVGLALRDPPKPRTAPVAQALVPVGAFQVLRDVHVTDSTRAPSTGTGRRDGLPGRVTLRPLKPGEAVVEADLGPRMAPEALAGRAVLSLSTLPARAPAPPQAGSRVGVVLSPRTPGTGGGAVLRDVLVLSVAQTDTTLRVVVAVPEADLAPAAALLGSSDVHLVASPSPL
ncbi:MAG TPA: hypothetical protein VEQ60_01095 [Longimicrobium sp.]|nr:hypothetical protein [Longimicrobium sp.]